MRSMVRKHNVINYILEQYGIKPDHPWPETPMNQVFRHIGNGKWFALLMEVSACKVGLEGVEPIDVLNIKGEPDMVAALAVQEGFAQAYHMNKKHWLSVILDGTVDEELLYNLIDISFEMTR